MSAEDFAEDPDFEESYFRGDYDTICECCGGQRVVTRAGLRNYEGRLADHRVMFAEQGLSYGDSRI